MAEAVVSIVVGRLTDLFAEEPKHLHQVRDEIQQLVTELMRIKSFLPDADSRISEQRVGILVAQVRDLVYDAEDVVETFLLNAMSSERRKTQGGIRNRVKRSACVLDDYVCHHKFSKGIKNILTRIQSLLNCFDEYDIMSTEGHGSSSSETLPGRLKRFHTFSVVEPEFFVGFQGDTEILVGHLVNESDDSYPVIFIGGMGGLGKTTLARRLYNHSAIKKHFSGLAWVSISQKWQAKAVLQRILIGLVHEKKAEILGMEVDKLVKNLLEIQLTKKCLIVLDDIWSNDAWDALKAAFPTETSGSKLLLTSRVLDVAGDVNPKCFIHKPQVLDAEQSWELLRLKALPKGDHVDTGGHGKMEELGREMVGKCGGLPLAIIVLGGILVTKPTLREWEKVYYDSRSSLKRGKGLGEVHQKEIFEILEWSYNYLPSQLKLCFLYLGKSVEGEEIEAEMLYQLWIAEGMVLSSDKREGETLMEVAESYMGELVHKSMVQVEYEDVIKSQRKFKFFQLHDLMRELSLSIATREELFKVVNLKKVNDFQSDPSLQGTSSSTRQLVVYSDGSKRVKAHPFLVNKYNQGRARSVLVFGSRYYPFPPASIVGSHVRKFRLLRVFVLEGFTLNMKSVSGCLFPIELGKMLGRLIHLRYLSIMGTNMQLCPDIQKLELLQTLKLSGRDMYLSPLLSRNILSRLGHLRHLHLPVLENCILGKNRKLRFDGLSKLETLENFDNRWCECKDLPKLVSLQKLMLNVNGYSCDVEEIIKHLSSYSSKYLSVDITLKDPESEIGADIWRQLFWNHKYNLQRLVIRSKLPELVKIFGQEQQRLDNTLNIDISLICITFLVLEQSCISEDPMPILEKILTLRLLILHNAYQGKELVCSAVGFPKLIHLVQFGLPNLAKWRMEKGSMPFLELLQITKCPQLEELPEGVRFLHSLRMLALESVSADFCDKIRGANGEQGPEFYKVAHVPDLRIE